MSVKALLMCWRFVLGIGIGAEYPLSACIAVEWSSRQHRAKMLSAVFLMQPLGQFCAYGVGLAVLNGLQYQYSLDSTGDDPGGKSRIGIDILWRIVTAVGALPALIAFSFRFLLPESGRYIYDVEIDARRAIRNTRKGIRDLSLANSRSNSRAINAFGRQRMAWGRERHGTIPPPTELPIYLTDVQLGNHDRPCRGTQRRGTRQSDPEAEMLRIGELRQEPLVRARRSSVAAEDQMNLAARAANSMPDDRQQTTGIHDPDEQLAAADDQFDEDEVKLTQFKGQS
ncbi:hypothetical protein LTR78_006148 [Recurvomyces mirabilis]|uniref:Major facilitator superfamily (MFS) profile domain-containing protein n=1 Tax=Recurvomyces mirabilis TaxID=574656 RepID=A0AAE0WLL6_9PEZI|nr:hypothetical protein LTR78_006148 [Recurvomyces mirabilis]KAK5151990.1 hypothetical protein LTS14_008764 [Recurvomyces mirabilis]